MPLEKHYVTLEDGGLGLDQEDIVCQTEPLFTRAGRRLMWKLKIKDF